MRPIVGAFAGYNFTAAGNRTVAFQLPSLPFNNVTVAFTTFINAVLFPSSNTTTTVVSRVIDVSILGVDTSSLANPARFTVQVPSDSNPDMVLCAYYDLESGMWSRRGVSRAPATTPNGRPVLGSASTLECLTTHLTHFAALLVSLLVCCWLPFGAWNVI